MKKWALVTLIFCFAACRNGSQQKVAADNHEFFPVVSFLQAQVHEVDSLGLPVYKYSVHEETRDSVLITTNEFRRLSQDFMEPDINDPSIKGYYEESRFADQSVPNITFTYATKNKDLPLQRIDIIINPDPSLNDQLQSVYMEKITTSGDTSIVKKLYWKSNQYFQIISSRQAGRDTALFSQLKVVWNATDQPIN